MNRKGISDVFKTTTFSTSSFMTGPEQTIRLDRTEWPNGMEWNGPINPSFFPKEIEIVGVKIRPAYLQKEVNLLTQSGNFRTTMRGIHVDTHKPLFAGHSGYRNGGQLQTQSK